MNKKALKEFRNMLRMIVREEIRSQLPQVVSEMYFRNNTKPIVERQQQQPQQKPRPLKKLPNVNKTSLMDALNYDDEDDDIPHALNNEDEGIYNSGPIGTRSESVTTLMGNKNPLNYIYEGLQPISREDDEYTEDNSYTESAPLTEGGSSRYAQILEATEQRDSRPMQKSPEATMRELEMRRQALEVKVG